MLFTWIERDYSITCKLKMREVTQMRIYKIPCIRPTSLAFSVKE